MFYKGLKIDPSVVPSNLIDEQTPNFQLKKVGNYPLFDSKDLKKKKSKLLIFLQLGVDHVKSSILNLWSYLVLLRIYGIAKKDNPKNITKWLKSYGNPFDKIGLDNDGISSIEWGVYGLPETFLINKDNKILYKHIGPIMKNDLEKINAFLK